MAIAGFGLVFVEIYLIQQGMSDVQKHITPEIFPNNNFIRRIQLY